MKIQPVPPTPKAVLFDWDNTLVDSWPVLHQALNSTFDAFGKPVWRFEDTIQRVRLSLRDAFPDMFGADWEQARDHFYKVFQAIHLQELTALPAAGAVIESLYNKGLYLGVVSNKTGKYLRQEARHLGWDQYFQSLIGAGDADRDKPALDPLHLALDNSQIKSGPEVWFVGDSGVDMQIARAGNCTAILICPEIHNPGEFDSCVPDYHFTCCHSFLAALSQI